MLLFDGTWNKREDTTNVWRMKMMLRHNQDQLIYYDEGVGTAKGEVLTGGALGLGLSAKVLNGYLWLMEHFEDAQESERGVADEIHVFGFSRGAYTARSLVGLMSIAGLLHRDAATRIRDAFELSRIEQVQERHPLSRTFRRKHSRDVPVRFLGVWDTVGRLGMPRVWPVSAIPLPSLEDNAWHKVVELPSIVQRARHALALDEKRKAFTPTLWPRASAAQDMEQRWFSGAHANVGGGYDNDGLFLRPLQWLQSEAAGVGLQFRKSVSQLAHSFYDSQVRDPLDESWYGAYKAMQRFAPWPRDPAMGGATNECLDYTVLERWLWRTDYESQPLSKALGHRPKWRPPARWITDQQLTEALQPQRVSATRGYHFF